MTQTQHQYSLTELQRIPTIEQGHTDDLKVQSRYLRVWLSRMTVADGMPYDHQVTVERYVDGVWTMEDQYQPR